MKVTRAPRSGLVVFSGTEFVRSDQALRPQVAGSSSQKLPGSSMDLHSPTSWHIRALLGGRSTRVRRSMTGGSTNYSEHTDAKPSRPTKHPNIGAVCPCWPRRFRYGPMQYQQPFLPWACSLTQLTARVNVRRLSSMWCRCRSRWLRCELCENRRRAERASGSIRRPMKGRSMCPSRGSQRHCRGRP